MSEGETHSQRDTQNIEVPHHVPILDPAQSTDSYAAHPDFDQPTERPVPAGTFRLAPESAGEDDAYDAGVVFAVRVQFLSGDTVRVKEDAVLGRSPEAAAAAEGKTAVPVPDPLRSISRVHARVFFMPQGLRLVDADSANGTWVRHGDELMRLSPGEDFWVEPGDRLWLGQVPIVFLMDESENSII